MDAAKLMEELYKITAPNGSGRIRVAYIPVGDENEVVKISEDTETEFMWQERKPASFLQSVRGILVAGIPNPGESTNHGN